MEYYKVFGASADDTRPVPVERVTSYTIDSDTDILTFYRKATPIAVFRDWSYFERSIQEIDTGEVSETASDKAVQSIPAVSYKDIAHASSIGGSK